MDEQAFIYKSTREIIERIGLSPTHPLPLIDVAASTAVIRSQSVSKKSAFWPGPPERRRAIALLMLQQLLDRCTMKWKSIPPANACPKSYRMWNKKLRSVLRWFYSARRIVGQPSSKQTTAHPSPRTDHCGGPLGIARESSQRPRNPSSRRRHPRCRDLIEARDQIAQALHRIVQPSPSLFSVLLQ